MWKKHDDSMKLDPKAVAAIMQSHGIRNSYELSKLIGRDKSEVKAWVTGKRGITWPNAHLIADALDCDIEQLTGEKPFVSDPESETDSVPSVNTSSTAGARGIAQLIDKTILGKVKIDEHLTSWDEEKKTKFLAAIADLLEVGCTVPLVGKARKGCVELRLRLTREQWERLEQAFAAGELAHLKVTKVEPFYDLGKDDVSYSPLKRAIMKLKQAITKLKQAITKPTNEKRNSMLIPVTCPGCLKTYMVTKPSSGNTIECPDCHTQFCVPNCS